MYKTNKNYAQGYIPQLDKPFEDERCFDLEDVFKKQKADRFLKNPQKYIQKTEVINFGIIHEEIKATALTRERVEKLKKRAETVLADDFKHYNIENKLRGFEGILKAKKKDRMLDAETKNSMKEFLLEHKPNSRCNCCFCS